MLVTGDLKIHKADGVAKNVEAIMVGDNGQLYAWESKPDLASGRESLTTINLDESIILSSGLILTSPDFIVPSDRYEMIYKDGKHWRGYTDEALIDEARERDDVDVDNVMKDL